MFRKSSPIEVEVDLSSGIQLTPRVLQTLILDLCKSLLQQRKQIPQQYEILQRDVEFLRTKIKRDNDELQAVCDSEEYRPLSLADLKAKRLKAKESKLDQRFLKSAQNFMEEFDVFMRNISKALDKIDRDSIRGVAFLIGPNPRCPKEVYEFRLKSRLSSEEENVHKNDAKKLAIKVFRTMFTNERIFSQLGKYIQLTNTFVSVIVSKDKNGPEPSDEGALGFDVLNSDTLKRARNVITFNLLNPSPKTFVQRSERKRRCNKKLRYSDEIVKSENVITQLEDSYSMMDMEMCMSPIASPPKSKDVSELSPAENQCTDEEDDDMIDSPVTMTRLRNINSPSYSDCKMVEATPFATKIEVLHEGIEAYCTLNSTGDCNEEIEWLLISDVSVKGFKDPRIKQ